MSGSSIPELLDQRAECSNLVSAMKAQTLAPTLTTNQWVERVSAVVAVTKSDLDWLNQDERRYLHLTLISYVKKALTEFYPNSRVPDEDMETALREFVHWMAVQDDSLVLDFVWDVLEYVPRRGWTTAWAPVRWLEWSGRLSRDISYDSLELALTFRDEAENMYCWPDERWDLADWQRDSQVYFTCTSHPSYVVRAWAAMALGRLYLNCIGARRSNTPSVAEILKWVQEQQLINPGIAGAFLNGTDWSMKSEDLSAFSNGFDFRSWFLDTLRLAKSEPDLPHIIPIEFYAHEYFELDEDAIREMLRMGRKRLAVMTATQAYEAIDRMAAVLQEMANSDDGNVARAIQEYLKVRAPHAGLRYMPEKD
jgi:hypothetical protein